ncbi:hypothetical protein SDC9_153200 [bioreactor metagenome]|uniref:Uncharacterized protein n=1 Tax=bioreactor metagenome TaxID=1076179 RepID=A0A645EWY5_9ZZZZ
MVIVPLERITLSSPAIPCLYAAFITTLPLPVIVKSSFEKTVPFASTLYSTPSESSFSVPSASLIVPLSEFSKNMAGPSGFAILAPFKIKVTAFPVSTCIIAFSDVPLISKFPPEVILTIFSEIEIPLPEADISVKLTLPVKFSESVEAFSFLPHPESKKTAMPTHMALQINFFITPLLS